MFWYKNGFYSNKPSGNAIELTNEEYESLMKDIGDGGVLQSDLNGRPKVVVTQEQENRRLENIRLKREIECFSVINRGQLWYESLTQEQKSELSDWYRQWLDVTLSKIIPNKPIWLK